VSVDQGRGVGNLEVVPDRRVRESTHVVYGERLRPDREPPRPVRDSSARRRFRNAPRVARERSRRRGRGRIRCESRARRSPRFVLDGGIEPDEEQPRDALAKSAFWSRSAISWRRTSYTCLARASRYRRSRRRSSPVLARQSSNAFRDPRHRSRAITYISILPIRPAIATRDTDIPGKMSYRRNRLQPRMSRSALVGNVPRC